MNTLRSCAAFGLGLSLACASGCSSSNSGSKDAGRDVGRDARFNTGTNTSTGTSTNGPCVFDGVTYSVGQSFTVNCVRYTCLGDNNVTSSGSPCNDGGPDTRLIADVAVPSDVRPADVAPPVDLVGRDAAPGETAMPDAEAPIDLAAPEDTTPPPVDTTPAIDLSSLGEDAAVSEDAPPVVQCTWGATKYNPGATFACDCNTCVCLDTGAISQLTSNDCSIDAR
jgi:hypothetical protein